ncbi:MAG: hypothetical protein HUU54_17100 [Ignavibacteriaceae bacterium]|nr:hypothetical protein [Ignavibacteriaceae bacterium]
MTSAICRSNSTTENTSGLLPEITEVIFLRYYPFTRAAKWLQPFAVITTRHSDILSICGHPLNLRNLCSITVYYAGYIYRFIKVFCDIL